MSKTKEIPVKSPCISVCALNDEDICTGCYRTGLEISYWGRMDNDRRREVLALCLQREKQVNPFL